MTLAVRREWWLQRRALRAKTCAICRAPCDFVVEVVDSEDDGQRARKATVVVRGLCSPCVHAARAARE